MFMSIEEVKASCVEIRSNMYLCSRKRELNSRSTITAFCVHAVRVMSVGTTISGLNAMFSSNLRIMRILPMIQ